MARKREFTCPKCKEHRHYIIGYKEGEKVYGHYQCVSCNYTDESKRIRVYFGFGEKGGRSHTYHKDLGKVELLQI